MPPSIWPRPTAGSGPGRRPGRWPPGPPCTRPSSRSTSTTARWATKAKAVWQLPWPSSSSSVVGLVVVLDGRLERPGRRSPRRPAPAGRRTCRPRVVLDGQAQRIERRAGAATCSKSRSRTARQARSTAPPDIHVWRDGRRRAGRADRGVHRLQHHLVDARGCVRAICWAIVTKPWPTSAVANFSVATPSASRQRAVEKSSKPSEYMRFLIDTPQPTPRTTSWRSAVRPAPPGRRIGSPS